MRKIISAISAGLFALAPSVFAETLFLPNPSGSTVLAGWIATNAVEASDALEFDGPWISTWTSTTQLPPSYNNGTADWALTSNFTGTNATGENSFYSFTHTNTTFEISTENYTGTSFSKIILQLTPNADDGRDELSNLTLTIGSTVFTASDATLHTSVSYGGDFSDPNNRYYGNFGSLALVTYEWDINALRFAGDLSNISVGWEFPQAHSAVYDLQLSVVNVPEPSAVVLMSAALVKVFWRLRRRVV